MTNRFVIADATKCIGCRTCEIACAVSHGEQQHMTVVDSKQFTPRLKVIKQGHITQPVMCRQCDNAPCANACPTQAIVLDQQSIQIIASRCIGCKACVVSCPFGAMSLTTLQQKVIAIKCDLCIDAPSGPACLSVCPTHAIGLITDADLSAMVNNKQQHIATQDMELLRLSY